MRQVILHAESWPCARPFRISTGVSYSFDSVVLQLVEGGVVGAGAGMPVPYMGETTDSVRRQLETVRQDLARGAGHAELPGLLPPGAARNAVDAALWDLRAQQQGISVWAHFGVREAPVTTVYTIGLEDEPRRMADKAAAAAQTLLKIKLDADRPLQRMQAIRSARPDAELIVDANQSWTMAQLKTLAPALADLQVRMIEQPLARGADAALAGYRSPVPLCADESCQHLGELAGLADGYSVLNIKLDKAGGLSHAWELAQAARSRGLELMVGCMGGHSLCVTPAHVLAQICRYVDLDGPLLLQADQPCGLDFLHGQVSLPGTRLWGRPVSLS